MFHAGAQVNDSISNKNIAHDQMNSEKRTETKNEK